ncbi:chromosome condensation complex Condensin, subunit G [Malassezia caprae]|uniref:Chromosome condensation complex Condensin, subunit G n=1 Tax=Malassezia caprae TaxID=1381934 RepID=A0AAF0E4M7_9BASI|nr:chromosome condensation complex Condensin, subunit G [Malassezia caprae]
MRDTLVVTVQAQLPPHFQDAQHSVANHRKNCVSLFRLHSQCAQATESTPRGTRLVGEKVFNECFFDCLHRILPLKKGFKGAERIGRFVATYAAYAIEQFAGPGTGTSDEHEDDTPATRFVAILLKHLLKGFQAKDKNVRLRCCTCVALLINSMDSLDDDLYETLVSMLMQRLVDKESAVRVQAVIALARLQCSEEGTDERTLRLLLHLLRHDTSADVRRAALFNIPPTAATLPYLLERLLDVDATNRRCVYLGSLKALLDAQPSVELESGLVTKESLGLGEVSLSEVVRIGLHERDQTVQKAARKLVTYWLEAAGGDVLTLLSMLHVMRSPNGEPVVLALLEDLPDVRASVARLLSDQSTYWADITPGKALLARCFVLYATTHHMERELETCVPVVTALVYRIQAEYHALNALLEQQAAEEMEEDMPALQDDRALAHVFVVGELLAIAMYCDYGDELGRRNMFMIVRDMLSNAWLPAELVARCLDVLLRLASGQRDFLQIVVELVQALDAELDEELDEGDMSVRQTLSWHRRVDKDASPAQAADLAALDARRLLIVRAMLERMTGTLQDETTLEGLIQELIVPTVQSKDAALREQGLVCLGLCSLLDKKTALITFPLLLNQIQRASGTIQARCVESLFDLTVVHGMDALCTQSASVAARNEFDGDEEKGLQYARQQLLGFLLSLLENEEPEIQAIASEGLAKLLLTGVLSEEDVLKSLILTYMSPDTATNQPLRQCLSYFLPLFCSSHARHQRMIQHVFMDVFDILANLYDDPDARAHMVSPTQLAAQLAEWSHPDRSMMTDPDAYVHVDMAVDAMKHALQTPSRDQRKALAQMLGKLAWPATLDATRATSLFLLGREWQRRADDATTRNALVKYEQALLKRYNVPEQGPDTEAMSSLEALVRSLPPPDETKPRARSRGSRATSVATERDVSSSDAESDDAITSEDEVVDEPRQPRRPLPAHAEVDEDEDELGL